ncbi:amidophosphoribosyltransferase [Alkalispirochaeta alkalica]|uniref:amidophosphoribosyltransferase n=1 Tax=Alkalispirochaeta alkalica TaxID=46356 RepID=UPI00035FFC2E|nr:amidophosphoribosyltransferase [Alkalispirochaeta alkalica]
MCGIVGIYAHNPVAPDLYDSMIQLQHRGQDAAGIITCNERFHVKKGMGLVQDIFEQRHMERLKGTIGIGHTRYPTSGAHSNDEVQPLWTSVPNGIAFAHNGNVVNYQEMRQEVQENRKRYLNSHSDSEMLLQLFADELHRRIGAGPASALPDRAFFEALFSSTAELFYRIAGAVSAVMLIKDRGLLAMRDPHGLRPLVYGQRDLPDGGVDHIFASEDTMFYMLGYRRVRDVLPGEIIYIASDRQIYTRRLAPRAFTPCIFEYVYFARPDAMLNNVNVYRSRLRMGENLGKAWKETFPGVRPDVIIPAPATANTVALSMARELGVNYSEGLYKNPFIGRTFIMPNQERRRQSVRYKLSPQELELRNKDVLIVDDSIVRGTTSKEIVQMVREFGARRVYFASACPPVTHPCYYGVDIPTREELIASTLGEEEIRDYLGADLLLYQPLDYLVEAVTRKGDHHIDTPCTACLGGVYIHRQDQEEMKRCVS